MSKRRKTRDEREKEKQKIRRRNQIYIENKTVMQERRKLGLPRARYRKNSEGRNNIEIWIGDAVNWCIKCNNPLIWTPKIALITNIIDEDTVEIYIGQNQPIRQIKVDKIRFDHRIKHYPKSTFKRIPKQY